MTSKTVREEMRWHEEQARLSREDNRTDSGIPLEALPSVRTTQPPGLEVDELSRDFLDSLTRDQLSAIAQELYLDTNRLRRELDALQGVIR
jgi:hypothetical protein